MSRDPRTDPKAGDVLRNGQFTRYVLSAGGSTVLYDQVGPSYRTERVERKEQLLCSIASWALWSGKAEVVHAEGEE